MSDNIRAAAINDIEGIYLLIRQLSRHDFTKEEFNECYSYNLERGRILVYERDGITCGCIVFIIHYHMHFSHKTMEIVNLVVDENVRGCGIGKELLAYVEKISIDAGCVRVEVDSGKQREAAHRFYYREGFTCSHYKLTKDMI